MKKLLAMILALTLVFSLAGCVTNITPDPTAPEKPGDAEQKLQFTVIVTHKDLTEKIFLYEVEPGKLGDVLEEAGLIVSQGADDGMFHTVDGEKADWNTDKSYWAFYEENDYAMTGIYDTDIVNGRTYKLVYTFG
jgi:hypothetical protein